MKLNFKGKEVLVIDDFVPGEERRNAAGIIVAVTKEDPYQLKEVLHTGAEVTKFCVGEKIYFKRALAESVIIMDKKFLMLPEGHIYCTVTEN